MASAVKDKGLIWPLIVVALLLSSVGMMMGVVIIAKSDGGAQVVDDYYDRAVAWDSLNSLDQAFIDQGWLTYLILDASTGRLVVQDSLGIRLSDLSGSVEMTRPQSAATGITTLFQYQEVDSSYTFEVGSLSPGLWDFTFNTSYARQVLSFSLRKEVR